LCHLFAMYVCMTASKTVYYNTSLKAAKYGK